MFLLPCLKDILWTGREGTIFGGLTLDVFLVETGENVFGGRPRWSSPRASVKG